MTESMDEAAGTRPVMARQHGRLRHSLRYVTFAWVFGATWLYITTGAVLTRFAQQLGVTEFGFGLLAALPFAGALVQLPTSYFIERYGWRKRIFMSTGIVHRLLWLGIAAIPWLFPESQWAFWLLAILMISSMSANAAAPAVMSWLADIVPARIRGRYFSRRMQVGQFVGLVATVAIGYALDRAEVFGPDYLIRTLSIILSIAAVCGALDFVTLAPVPSPRRITPDPQLNFWNLIREPLRDPNFRRFMGFTATLTFAIGYVGQFIWLYVFDVVGMSNTQANLLLVAAPLLVQMICYPAWGRLIDRLGRKPVLIIAGLLIVNGGTAWIFVTPETWWVGYVAVTLATAAWPGVELANLNLLLNLTDSRGGRQRSAYVALHSMSVAVAGVLSGLFGGTIAHLLEGWSGSFMGWPLTYHGILFLTSAALRLAAIAWLIGLSEPKAYGTRAAIRYMAVNIYSNMQQAVFMPTRRLGSLARRTYRITWPKRRNHEQQPPLKPTSSADNN